jgi:hypothetical protein
MGFGTPSSGNGNFKPLPKSFPKEGQFITVRILPPILSCQDSGEWNVPHAQHFGYTTPRTDDPSKKRYHTFYCIEQSEWRDGNRVVTTPCPECNAIKQKQAEYTLRASELESKGIPKDQVKKTLEPLGNWLYSHNRDFKYYVNVKDISGAYYTLKLPGKVKKSIDQLRKELMEANTPCDIIAAHQGYWLRLGIVSGRGAQAVYKVEVLKEDVSVGGETYQKNKAAPLTEADAEAAETQCLDLKKVGIRKLPMDKIKLLVESCGEAGTVAAIFRSSEREVSPDVAPDPVPTPAQKPQVARPEPVKPVTPPVQAAEPEKASQRPQPPPQASTVDDAEEEAVAAAERLLAAAKAKRATKQIEQKVAQTKPPEQKPVEPQPKPPEAPGGDMSAEEEADFLAQFRLEG